MFDSIQKTQTKEMPIFQKKSCTSPKKHPYTLHRQFTRRLMRLTLIKSSVFGMLEYHKKIIVKMQIIKNAIRSLKNL